MSILPGGVSGVTMLKIGAQKKGARISPLDVVFLSVPYLARWNRRREEPSGPEDPHNDQCPDGIEGLSHPVCDGRFATTNRNQVFKARLEPNANKTKSEKPVSVGCAEALNGFGSGRLDKEG